MEPQAENPQLDLVARAKAHQEMEISLIGDRDPADVQGLLVARVEELMGQAGASAAKRPRPEEWSVLEVLAHLVDTEVIYAGRYRSIIAHDRPPMVGYDPELMMSRRQPSVEDEDPADLMELLRVLRNSNIRLWRSTTQQHRQRVAIHPERGPESLATAFRQVAGHDVLHLDQMARTIDAVVSD